MTSVFDWRGPATVRIEDTSHKAHRANRSARMAVPNLNCSWARQVAKCDEHGRILKVYPTCAAAARDNDMTPQAIHNVLQGKAKTAGGFKWQDYKKPMGMPRSDE